MTKPNDVHEETVSEEESGNTTLQYYPVTFCAALCLVQRKDCLLERATTQKQQL
eukprot:m.201854 g.201854  ORF g.201854 m.201854 type:complete len:54 (-) comp14972_c1_seq2:124-285(-)